ncbi:MULTISPECIES: hypothetical protein [Bacillaceae]|uniref:Uncharacterized protein n=1 Tax=Evansella alkalicola TaxID=745819 RepID=A0ABS6JUM5_9BACI|nr:MULTISPECIES: hypothetical protein [Bacillaceae]MBU9722110.1 hypothetical protein [Bacillus alkalicola]
MRIKKNYENRRRHTVLVILIILLALSSNSLPKIPKFYKNMIYVSSFNGLYYLLCRRHLVWEFIPNIGVNWLLLRLVHTILVTPLVVLVFLSEMPHTLSKQFIHFARWITISFAVEYLIHKEDLILYAHGWNVFWSGVIYVKMYFYSYLITKRPLLTLFLSFCSTIYFITKFNVPLKKNHISRYFEPLVDVYYHTFLEDLTDKKRKIFGLP